MKKALLVVMAVFMCAGISVSWVGKKAYAGTESGATAGNVTQKARETGETAARYAAQKKNEYQQKVKAELQAFKKKLHEMRGKAARLKGRTRTEFDRTVNRLREKRRAISKELDNLKARSGKAWEDLKVKTDHAMRDLKRAYDRAASRFR